MSENTFSMSNRHDCQLQKINEIQFIQIKIPI